MESYNKILWALELSNIYSTKDLLQTKEKLYSFLDILVYLHDSLTGLKVEDYEAYSEQLIIKFYLHGISICKIGESYKLESKYFDNEKLSKIDFIDISSLLTLVRAQLETLLMYQHLYVNTTSVDEQKLRCYSWILTALLQRIQIPAKEEKTKIQKDKDLKSIEKLKSDIQALNSYKFLSSKQQIGLLEKGSAKTFKIWDKIFEESNFLKRSYLYKSYYLLSVYAHSEGLSVMQLKDAGYFANGEHNYNLNFMNTFCSLVMTSVMIKNITNKYKIITEKFETLEEKEKFEIDFFYRLGTGNN